MSRAIWRCVVVVAVCWVLPAYADLQRDIDRLIERAQIPRLRAGVSVVDLSSGRTLAVHDVQDAMIPASNMKLLTTGAALDVLGTEFAFRTRFRIAGDRLIIQGAGDPALGDPAMLALSSPPATSEDLIGAVVRAVKDSGVGTVSEIVIDDRIFDREEIHELWPRDQLDRHYCAPVSGLIFHRNVIDFYISPAAREGDPPLVDIDPAMDWIEGDIVNRARTVASGANKVGVLRDQRENRFTIIGEVRRRSVEPVRKAVHDPQLLWGRLFADRLARAGLTDASGGTASVRLVREDERFDDARDIAVISTPLTDIVRLCNVESINLYAEALLKRMGHEVTQAPGSWAGGASAIRLMLAQRLGPSAAGSTMISDGSGMSRANRVSAGTLTAWLASLWHDGELRDVFVGSLPTRGEGTLDNRFRQTPLAHTVRAKSGYINNVYTLSGYLIDEATGNALAFSILLNDVPMGQGWKAKRLHEQIVQACDQWLSEQARELVEAQGG